MRFLKVVLTVLFVFDVVGTATNTERRIIMPDVLNKDKLRYDLIKHEGNVPYAYQDSLGFWTIGIGHLIDHRKNGSISADTILYIFNKDVEEKCGELDEHLSWWRNLDEVRQRVLVNMCFNMGINNLLGFHNTLAFIEHGQYKEAAAGMLDSKWAVQVGARARELAEMMETGI